MKLLFVDHRDSFSANLVAALRVAGAFVNVVQYSELPSSEAELAFMAKTYDGLVLSPGPGKPSEYPLSALLYRVGFYEKPVLGVCLGLQIVLESEGFVIESVSRCPLHGRQSKLKDLVTVYFDLSGPWVFYNSLGCLASTELLGRRGWRVLAREKKAVAAVDNFEKFQLLVQFHPESFASPGGHNLLQNFVELGS